jgi:hypothetical protein
MHRNDKISLVLGIIFLFIFAYFLYIQYSLYAIGWLILSIALLLGAYNPRDTSSKELLVLIDIILPFVAIGILIYAFIYG